MELPFAAVLREFDHKLIAAARSVYGKGVPAQMTCWPFLSVPARLIRGPSSNTSPVRGSNVSRSFWLPLNQTAWSRAFSSFREK